MSPNADRRADPIDVQDERPAHLGSLIGGFAHEIKNPLSTIGLNLRLMAEELQEPLSPREKRILTRTQKLSKEVGRLQGIVEDFLAYVRPAEPALQRVSLNGLVREVADLIAPEMEARNISLKLLLTEGLADATIDPRLVHQVLLNLLRNAEQALVESGRVGEVIVGTELEDGAGGRWHRLTVTDSGPGMSDEVRDRCFQPYFSTKRGGTGLGLPITRRFVEDHGGDIEIETQEGVGTRFIVRLPYVPERAEEKAT